MKKVLAVVAAVGCLAAAGTALGGVAAGTGVNGSLHDMTKVVGVTADKMERVCVYCHTPHAAVVTSPDHDNLPLWNHEFGTQEFTPYVWATPNNKEDGAGNQFTIDPLIGPTRLCMSCHDGSVAIDQHGVAMAEPGGTQMGLINRGYEANRDGRSKISDLTTTHPIGFDYNAIASYRNSRSKHADQQGNTEIVASEFGYAYEVTTALRPQGEYNLVSRYNAAENKAIRDNLYDKDGDGLGDIMTCATCHEVHNKENATQEPFTGTAVTRTVLGENQTAPNYFLYAKEARSLICLSCHVK
jgi:hypothetical protein